MHAGLRLTHAVVLALALPTANAMAGPGNAERYPIGASEAGMGGAGIANSEMPWHNVAGLGHVTAEGLSASLSVYGYTSESAANIIDLNIGGQHVTGPLVNESVELFPG